MESVKKSGVKRHERETAVDQSRKTLSSSSLGL